MLQELQQVQENAEFSSTIYNGKLEEKDKIIEDLRKQLKRSKEFTSGDDQIVMQHTDNDSQKDGKFNAKILNIVPVVVEPSQIEILTNALLEKQALLEALTAEKNTLALKVEKWEACISIYSAF